MTRIQALIAMTAVALVLPLGAALAQAPGTSTTLSGPVTNPARTLPSSPDDVPSPMQEQAMAPDRAPSLDKCGPSNAVAMKDEFGHKYNCRGDRVR